MPRALATSACAISLWLSALANLRGLCCMPMAASTLLQLLLLPLA